MSSFFAQGIYTTYFHYQQSLETFFGFVFGGVFFPKHETEVKEK